MMMMFLIGFGAITALIGITLLADMPPIDEFGQKIEGGERDGN